MSVMLTPASRTAISLAATASKSTTPLTAASLTPHRRATTYISTGAPAPVSLDQGFELRLEIALHVRAVADGPVGRLPVLEDDHGRDRHDPELHRRRRVLVDVHLHDLDLVAQLAVDLLHDRGDHPARAAPGGPEVDQHRLVGLEDLALELCIADGLDV